MSEEKKIEQRDHDDKPAIGIPMAIGSQSQGPNKQPVISPLIRHN